MIPRPSGTGQVTSLVVLAVALLAGCSGATASPSFDPSSACAGADEQRMPGAYPELEVLVPVGLAGATPSSRDSGRLCSKVSLGALAGAGVTEMRFGGGTWDRGGGKGISLVTFEATGLTARALFDSYVAGARANSQNHDIQTSEPTIAGAQGYRMDLLSGESFESLVVWPGDQQGRVRVVLSADQTDADIQAAIDAFD